MRFEITNRTAFIMIVGLTLTAGCSPTLRFERVEHFPPGIQIDTYASAWTNRLRPSEVSEQFDARYEDVWQAAKEAARRLGQRVEKAELIIDGAAGKIQILDEQHVPENTAADTGTPGTLRRPKGSKLSGWRDEFLILVSSLSERRTKVTVSRVVLGIPRFRFCFYVAAMCERGTLEPEISNGQLENWLLTQISDVLEQATVREKFALQQHEMGRVTLPH